MKLSRSTHLLMFVFADFNVHHKDWLSSSGGTDRPGELYYNFLISNDLTQIVNFPTWIPYCHSHSPALLDFAAAIVHRNHFMGLYQQNKSSESIVKFRQASNLCKRVLEAAKLAYANKTKESITSQKLGSLDFW